MIPYEWQNLNTRYLRAYRYIRHPNQPPMKSAKITIRNYRSIPYNNPITFEFEPGITFILGVNNIGKSNLLRLFYELRFASNFADNAQQQFGSLTPYYSTVKNQNSTQNDITVEFKARTRTYVMTILPRDPSQLHDQYFSIRISAKNILETDPDHTELNFYQEVFQQSMYVGSFRTTFFQTSADYYDVKVGHSFIKTFDSWANGANVTYRKKISTLKEELKELFGFKIFDISANETNTNLNVVTDDGFFTLDELGGGISHFILVLGNALIREPSFILIDEPENALHPKMQEMFVRILASKAKYGVIATSHSIGLARSVGADRIYSLSKDYNGRLSLTQYGDSYKPSIMNTISELGYSQFVELGGNNILLVEGPTDIKCFKEILRKYHIEQHFIIMDLGGASNINDSRYEELSELKRLNAKSYNVIFDSEISKPGEPLKPHLEKFKVMCEEKLNFNVFPTDVYATDNYLTQDVVTRELGSSYQALDKFENINDRSAENKWGKSLNWKMFREMKKEDFAGTGLDEFITNVLIPQTK